MEYLQISPDQEFTVLRHAGADWFSELTRTETPQGYIDVDDTPCTPETVDTVVAAESFKVETDGICITDTTGTAYYKVNAYIVARQERPLSNPL